MKHQLVKILQYRRKSIRLPGYDYTQTGYYFVTICVQGGDYLLCKIKNGIVYPNNYGEIVNDCWIWLTEHYPYINLDCWILMPNHLHGILHIKPHILPNDCRGGSRTAPTSGIIKIKTLGRLIGAFKTVSTKKINQIRNTPGSKIWQRGFYEHIIRNEREYYAFHQYIIDNPIRWNK